MVVLGNARTLSALVFGLGACIVAMVGPATAAGESSVTLDLPDGVVTDESSGYAYLLGQDPSAGMVYTFSGTAQSSDGLFHVRVSGLPASDSGPPVTVCESDQLQPGPDSQAWNCTFKDSVQHRLPSFWDLSVELISDDNDDRLAHSAVNIFVLGTPLVDATEVDVDDRGAVLSGDRPFDMGVEVYPGKLSGSSVPADTEPVCTDMRRETGWSCQIHAEEWDPGSHQFSARYVPFTDGPFLSGFQLPSNFRSVTVTKPAPDPEPEPEPVDDSTSTPPPPTANPEPPRDTAPGLGPPENSAIPGDAGPAPGAGLLQNGRPQAAQPPPPPDTEPSGPQNAEAPGLADGQDFDDGHGSADHRDVIAAASGNPVSGASASTFGHELPTMAEVISTAPGVVGGATLLGGAFVMFVALPSELLHATLRKNYGRAFGRIAGVLGGVKKMAPFMSRFALSPWFTAAAILTTAAIISAMAMATSAELTVWVRLALAMLAAFVTTNGLSVALGWMMGRRFQAAPQLKLMPGFLVLSAASVVFSRLVGLQPAILFGILMVVTFATPLRRQDRGAMSTMFCGTFLAIGALAWGVFSLIGPGTNGFSAEFLREYLTTLTTGGIGYCVVALLPMTYLEGQPIFQWSKRLWASLYVIVIVIFQLTVVRMPASWHEFSGAAMLWSLVFGSFGLLSLAVWAWFRFRPAPTDSVAVAGD